jgi:hypothetical protein
MVITAIVGCRPFIGQRSPESAKHNAIIFVADGLRPTSINSTDTPTLYDIQQKGVILPVSLVCDMILIGYLWNRHPACFISL